MYQRNDYKIPALFGIYRIQNLLAFAFPMYLIA